ncbi:hypothetical protein AB7W84_06895 [Providencia rettgeri]
MLTLNEDALHKQCLFWIAFLVPIIASAVLGYFLIKKNNLHFEWNNIEDYLNSMKLPLLVLAISPTLSYLVVNSHRSLQTKKQIETTENKNNFDIFLNQMKYIESMLSEYEVKIHSPINIDKEQVFKINNPNFLIIKIYGYVNAKNKFHGEVRNSFKENLECKLNSMMDNIASINSKISDLGLALSLFPFSYLQVKNDIQPFLCINEINEFYTKLINFPFDNKKIRDSFFTKQESDDIYHKIRSDNLNCLISIEESQKLKNIVTILDSLLIEYIGTYKILEMLNEMTLNISTENKSILEIDFLNDFKQQIDKLAENIRVLNRSKNVEIL